MKSRNILIGLMFFVLIGALVRGKIMSRKLLSDYKIGEAKVLGFEFGSNNGGGVQFKCKEIPSNYLLIQTITMPGCKDRIRENARHIKNNIFPVAYSPNNTSNYELILFKDQFIKYKIEVPEKLEEVVYRISVCR